jgi:hypothetical protein
VKAGKRIVALTKHSSEAMQFTGAGNAEELWVQIEALLEELCQQKCDDCYAGRHPPEKSYEDNLKDLELWPYRWQSSLLSCEVYLKFCMRRDYFFFVDCHENRQQK